MATVEFDLVIDTSPAERGIKDLDDALSSLLEASEGLTKGFDTLFKGISSASVKAGEAFRLNLFSPFKEMRDVFSRLPEEAESFGYEFIDSFVAGFSSAWRYHKRALADIADDVLSLFQFAGSPPFFRVRRSGYRFISSFAAGIEEASPDLLGKVADTALEVVDTLIGGLREKGGDISKIASEVIGGPFLSHGSVASVISSFFKGGGLEGMVKSAEDIFLRFFGDDGSIPQIFKGLFGSGGTVETIFSDLFGEGGRLSSILSGFLSQLGGAFGWVSGILSLMKKINVFPEPWEIYEEEHYTLIPGERPGRREPPKGSPWWRWWREGNFQHGTPYVPETGLYQLHKGEAVIPAWANPFKGGVKTEAKVENHLTLHLDVSLDGEKIKQFVFKNIETATKDGAIKLHPIAVKEF